MPINLTPAQCAEELPPCSHPTVPFHYKCGCHGCRERARLGDQWGAENGRKETDGAPPNCHEIGDRTDPFYLAYRSAYSYSWKAAKRKKAIKRAQ